MKTCKICNRMLDNIDDPVASDDCGGDCCVCMAHAGDPEALGKMFALHVTKVARVTHQLNKAYCEMLEDNSQLDWERSPQWQKQSAVDGVLFHSQNPDASDSASHDNWMKDLAKAGWTYGPEKSPEKREHPCMVPFDELPVTQQLKDKLFRQTVHALMLLGPEQVSMP